MRFNCKPLITAMLALLLAAGLPAYHGLADDQPESGMGATPRLAPVTPGVDLSVKAALEASEAESLADDSKAPEEAVIVSPFPGQASIIPSISTVSHFCKRPGSLAYMTSDGCRAALSRFSQYYGKHLYYETMQDCLDFLQSQRVKRHVIVEEHQAWCDQTFNNLHDRKGCYDAAPVFLGSLTETGFCRKARPLPVRPKDSEAPYIYDYKEPGQKIDTPKTGAMPSGKSSGNRGTAVKPAQGKTATSGVAPLGDKPRTAQSAPKAGAAAGAGPDSASTVPGASSGITQSGSAGTSGTTAGASGATAGAVPGADTAPATSGAAVVPAAQGLPATSGPAAEAPGIAGQPSGGSMPQGGTNSPVGAPVAAPVQPIAPATEVPATGGSVSSPAPAVNAPGAVPAGQTGVTDGFLAPAGAAPAQGLPGSISALPPPMGVLPVPPGEPVIGTRVQAEPLPPVPSIGRIAPELMPGVPPDKAVSDATLPAPDALPVTQPPRSTVPALDAFGEVIPNFVPPPPPDPLANPTQALPVGRAPAGQSSSRN